MLQWPDLKRTPSSLPSKWKHQTPQLVCCAECAAQTLPSTLVLGAAQDTAASIATEVTARDVPKASTGTQVTPAKIVRVARSSLERCTMSGHQNAKSYKAMSLVP